MKHILFDFDGTIVDSRYIIVDMINRLADKYNLKIIQERDYKHLQNLSVLERCRFVGLPLYKLPLFKLDINKQYSEFAVGLKPAPGLKEVMDKLKQSGLGLSIVSSNSAGNINRFLVNNNIDLIDNIYSSNNIFGKDKSIAGFLKRFKLQIDDVIYVGDEIRDIEACRKTNVKIIAVTWGYDSRDLLSGHKPDHLIDHPAQLLELLVP